MNEQWIWNLPVIFAIGIVLVDYAFFNFRILRFLDRILGGGSR